MTPEEQAEVERLVGLIQTEQDQQKFMDLVVQLNALLAQKEQRINEPLLARKQQRINGVPKKQV